MLLVVSIYVRTYIRMCCIDCLPIQLTRFCFYILFISKKNIFFILYSNESKKIYNICTLKQLKGNFFRFNGVSDACFQCLLCKNIIINLLSTCIYFIFQIHSS